MMNTISSKLLISTPARALIVGIALSAYAMGATESYTPTHPDCTAKPAAAPVAAPAPKPVQKPLPTPAPTAVAEADSDKDGVVDSKDECPDTPLGYKVDPKGCPVSVTLHIMFPFNSSVIPPSNESDVANLAKILKENPPAKAVIIGHTDSVGADKFNQTLSEKRSKALGDKLIANGIEASRITTMGKGEKEPVATNSTREGRAQNRRIQVNLK